MPIISVPALEALVRTVRALEHRQPMSEEGVTPSCSTGPTPSRSPPAHIAGEGAEPEPAVGFASSEETPPTSPRAQLARGEGPSIDQVCEGGAP